MHNKAPPAGTFMKREEAFSEIFTNPATGEEYNIFTDETYGKRLEWNVGTSEDGKETVKPVNISFREIDLSKLDSVELPKEVSPEDIKGYTVAQITAGKVDFESTGHNGYEWDKSDFYVLSPDMKCVSETIILECLKECHLKMQYLLPQNQKIK